jgi:formylglycine-generating enzyme required for sulfatase activity
MLIEYNITQRFGACPSGVIIKGAVQKGASRVLRGGSWRNDNDDNYRAANRNNDDPSRLNDNNGLRACLPELIGFLRIRINC